MKTVLFLGASLPWFQEGLDGWQTVGAQCHEEALAALLRQDVEAVVLDLEGTACEAPRFLQQLRSGTVSVRLPCLVLAGPDQLEDVQAALEAGASDFLIKPLEPRELAVRLRRAVSLEKQHDRAMALGDSLREQVRETTHELELSRRSVILRLAMAAEGRDNCTGEHIMRVALLSRLIADSLGFDADAQERMLLASPLHDVGKIVVPDHILLKSGPLSESERLEMQKHCEAGFRLLAGDFHGISSQLAVDYGAAARNELLDHAALIAMTHHERWDGSGYPQGLRGEGIPVEGRIVAVADVYDALRSARPYKTPSEVEEALNYVRRAAERHFDPRVVEALLSRVDEAEEIVHRYREGAVLDWAS